VEEVKPLAELRGDKGIRLPKKGLKFRKGIRLPTKGLVLIYPPAPAADVLTFFSIQICLK